MDVASDGHLIVNQGNRAGVFVADFAAIYTAHRDRLARALAITLGDDSLATEAVDEAFTRALHRWHLIGAFDEPQAWVYRTARNWATSRFRRRARDRKFAPTIAGPESIETEPADPALAKALRSRRPSIATCSSCATTSTGRSTRPPRPSKSLPVRSRAERAGP